MVKCLNDGVDGYVVSFIMRSELTFNPSPAEKCPKFLKADYAESPYRDRRNNLYYDLLCPVCKTGFSELTREEFKAIANLASRLAREKFSEVFEEKKRSIEARNYLSGKEKEKQIEDLEIELSKTYLGEEESEKKKKIKEAENIKISPPATTYSKYIKEATPSIGSATAGLVASALLSSPWFFFASLAFAASFLVPGAHSIGSVQKEAEKIKHDLKTEIREAKGDPQAIRIATEKAKALAEVETLLEKADKDAYFAGMGQVRFYALLKDALRAVGFFILVLSLISSSLPLAGLIGLIIGFAAYFSFHPERKPDEKEE